MKELQVTVTYRSDRIMSGSAFAVGIEIPDCAVKLYFSGLGLLLADNLVSGRCPGRHQPRGGTSDGGHHKSKKIAASTADGKLAGTLSHRLTGPADSLRVKT